MYVCMQFFSYCKSIIKLYVCMNVFFIFKREY